MAPDLRATRSQPARPARLLLGLGLLGAAALPACGSDGPSLLVRVGNVPADATKLNVLATLNGQPAKAPTLVSSPLDRFGVSMPSGSQGELLLQVDAFDSDECTVASSELRQTLSGSYAEAQLPLNAVSPRRCQIQMPCGPGQLCVRSPLPQSNSLFAIWAVSPTDVWAVGKAGAAVHYDGSNWTTSNTGVTTDLYGVWASGPQAVWAVGKAGRILKYDGSAWTSMSSPTTLDLNAIHGASPTDIFAVGKSTNELNPGVIVRYNGLTWTTGPTPTYGLYGVYALTPMLVYASGPDGLITRYNGLSWNDYSTVTFETLLGVYAPSATTVLAVGTRGTIVRYLPSSPSSSIVYQNSNITAMYGITGDGATATAVGAGGAVVTGAGTFTSPNWSPMLGQTPVNLYGVTSVGGTTLAAGQTGSLFRLTGNTLSPQNGPFANLRAIYGASPTDVWAVGDGGAIYHDTGSGWVQTQSPTVLNLTGIWGSGPNNIWAIGEQRTVLRYDGSRWTAVLDVPTGIDNIRGIWGTPGGMVFLVGNFGSITSTAVTAIYDGSKWSTIPEGSSGSFWGVWGSGPGDVWLVGDLTISHYTGGTTLQKLPTTSRFRAVWGSSASDVWAVGQTGAISHFTAGAWAPVSGVTTKNLTGVYGSSAKDVWVVGDTGTVLRYDGASFQQLTSSTTLNLTGAWGSKLYDFWAVGEQGITLRSQR